MMGRPDNESIYAVAREIVEALKGGYDVLASAAADDMRELFAKEADDLAEMWSDEGDWGRDSQVAADVAGYFRKGGE